MLLFTSSKSHNEQIRVLTRQSLQNKAGHFAGLTKFLMITLSAFHSQNLYLG